MFLAKFLCDMVSFRGISMRQGTGSGEVLPSQVIPGGYGPKQGCTKHLKLGGHNSSRALSSLRHEATFKDKKGTSLFIAKSWGTRAPSAHCAPPVPMSTARSRPLTGIRH